MKKTATLVLLVMMSMKSIAGDEPLKKITSTGISFMMPSSNRGVPKSYGPATLLAGIAATALGIFETNANYYTVVGGTNSPTGSYPYTGTRVYKPFIQQWPRNILVLGGCSMIVLGFSITLKS